MNRNENEAFAKRVVHFYENQANHDHIFTIKHFELEGKPRNTIYRIINRYKQRGKISYLKLPGRHRVKSTIKNIKKVKNIFKANPRLSVRKWADKIGI